MHVGRNQREKDDEGKDNPTMRANRGLPFRSGLEFKFAARRLLRDAPRSRVSRKPQFASALAAAPASRLAV
jgi:hypothetical protein